MKEGAKYIATKNMIQIQVMQKQNDNSFVKTPPDFDFARETPDAPSKTSRFSRSLNERTARF